MKFFPTQSRKKLHVTLIALAISLVCLVGVTSSPAPVQAQASNIPPVQAAYHGVKAYDGFFEQGMQADAWTHEGVAFYAPAGLVSQENANQFLAWYARADAIHRSIVPRTDESFEEVYRKDDPHFGRKKVLAFVYDLGDGAAGRGDKGRAEAGVPDLMEALADPTNITHHYVLIYEMMRSWTGETSDYRAMWPQEQVIQPHLMASFVVYEAGGIDLLLQTENRHNIPGKIYRDLDNWKQDEHNYLAYFPDKEQTFYPEYFPIMPSIIQRVGIEQGFEAVGRILDNLSTYPSNASYESATQAVCDFQAAINDATNNAYAAAMVNDWGLPATCPGEPPSPATFDGDLRFAHSGLCLDRNSATNTATQFDAVAATTVGQNACDGSDDQRFIEVATANGFLLQFANSSDFCLDVSGVNLVIWSCHGATNQEFQWDGDQLRSVETGNCITVTDSRLNRGSNLTVEPCVNAPNQRINAEGAAPVWDSCQEMSDALGTHNNVTWGDATEADREWWIANGCTTRPSGSQGPRGDVDCSTTFTIADALALAHYLAGSRTDAATCPLPEPATQVDLGNADLNDDGAINADDVRRMLGCLTSDQPSSCLLPAAG